MGKFTDLYNQVEQKVDGQITPAWARPLRDHPRTAVIVMAALLVLVLLLSAPLWARDAHATGGGDSGNDGQASAAAFADSHATASSEVSVTGGSVGGTSASQSVRTYAGGSTGLTSTAPCLGSVGILFNALSSTVAQEGCIIRLYAEKMCADDACRLRMACLDPDLPPPAKAVIGCASVP